jgi:hypothetical protein
MKVTHKSRVYIADGVTYPTLASLASAHGITREGARWRISSPSHRWFRVIDGVTQQKYQESRRGRGPKLPKNGENK